MLAGERSGDAMNCPHRGAGDCTGRDDGGHEERRPHTYHQVAQRFGPGRHAARERYDELSTRDHLARAYAMLRASGEYDPAKHGAPDAEPLTAEEHLELLAIGEYLARSYKPVSEVDNALRAGTTWDQIAEALDTDEAMARVTYRAWADGQHDLLRWTEGRLGMSEAEYADAIERAGEADPGAAKAYAATHRVLCAHADDDGRGAHWLAPGEKCTLLPVEREPEAAAPPGHEEQRDPQASGAEQAGPEMEPGG
jgi:hypothetical protein